ncbi:hypothetical protein IGI04_015400 [Brassica rapa subsp. trilocularis]|uniref:Zinc finger DNA-directed DNA polymerase family B alpha domain-containing protein n=1 Tax=Brassica rapa subsp. trilocularis TaxID=1813537 RepID=A0ABQ7MPX8_BRACM|nr:hypothetical protein IGI04_015400 [Brassica rapa subsp. trilocularis]
MKAFLVHFVFNSVTMSLASTPVAAPTLVCLVTVNGEQFAQAIQTYTEADLYKQLSYVCHILDTQCSLEKIEVCVRIQVEKAITKIRHAFEAAASIARSIRDRCAYGWVQLTDIAM